MVMATFEQIKSVRLKIFDPADAINILSVADPASLPSAPVGQTAYFVVSTGLYMMTPVLTGAVSSDYKAVELLVIDQSISTLIDSNGEIAAIRNAILLIISQLGRRLGLSKLDNGSESFTYTSLKDMYSFYKDLIQMYENESKVQTNNSTGRVGKVPTPVTIAGGLL